LELEQVQPHPRQQRRPAGLTSDAIRPRCPQQLARRASVPTGARALSGGAGADGNDREAVGMTDSNMRRSGAGPIVGGALAAIAATILLVAGALALGLSLGARLGWIRHGRLD